MSLQEGTYKLRGCTHTECWIFVADSSNSGGENMYTMMKSVPGGSMPGVSVILVSNTSYMYGSMS
jgi:hypothetical protein